MRDLAATTECIDGEAAGVKVDRFASPSITLALRWRRSTSRIGARCRPQRGFRSPSDTAGAQTRDG